MCKSADWQRLIDPGRAPEEAEEPEQTAREVGQVALGHETVLGEFGPANSRVAAPPL